MFTWTFKRCERCWNKMKGELRAQKNSILDEEGTKVNNNLQKLFAFSAH
jgi:hypothetical protein